MIINQTLPVPLTDADLAQAADDLVDVLNHRDELEAEKKTVDDGYKKQIAATESQESTLRKLIESKQKMADVECLETEVPGTNEIVVVRLDTGAEVSRRQMTTAESQTEMFADAEEDEVRGRVLAVIKLKDVLSKAGVNATTDVLWEISEDQASEAMTFAAERESNAEVQPPDWLAELIAQHPAVHDTVADEAVVAAETAAAEDESTAEPTGDAPAAASASETASKPAAAGESAPAATDTGKKRKKKAGKTDPATEAGKQAEHAAASNGRLDEVDVQEELEKAGIKVGLDLLAGLEEPQLIDAVNFARVVVARQADATIEEPKRPAFLPA